ncbi:TlpA family protein disulfide reductase [Paenibacillus terrigena]|uniref:TlpA family protein disulfide reductase n=1 Tax=Paenibacillus terrigena TaxID=369333 RepID=UPI00037D58FD|nr:TlpA disulfide reductase family protein [Paenibacillus terrigena]
MRRNLWLLVVIVLLVTIAINQNGTKKDRPVNSNSSALPTEAAPMLNKLAPGFELEALDGKTYSVGGKRDKVTMINFWASWCEPCQEEAPDLKRFSEQYKEKLDLYSVNVTSTDTLENAKAFVAQYQLTNPILMDTKGDQFKLYKGIAFPTNILIDRDGVIRDITIGVVPAKTLEEKIQNIIAD